jgi:hypothetical protein
MTLSVATPTVSASVEMAHCCRATSGVDRRIGRSSSAVRSSSSRPVTSRIERLRTSAYSRMRADGTASARAGSTSGCSVAVSVSRMFMFVVLVYCVDQNR